VASLALYRKYRPRTFDEVIGQEHITGPLTQAIRNGRLHHAYLFSGPRGCGKTSSARILARSLNCVKGPTPQPCGECDSCVALAPDGHGSVDVIEIDAASHGGVDDARELRERAFFSPVSSRYKVYVIDEAHMVSSAGFNALLKLVEEPPEYVMFVFATTEAEKVLPTIRSRTHHYPFRLIPPGVLRPYLEQVCKAEQIQAEAGVFPLVVRAGAGSVRDSLSVLDQLIAGADERGVTYQRAVQLLGVTDVALIDEVCDGFAAADGGAVFQAVDRVVEAGHDPRRFAGDLLERLRDLIVLNQVPDAASKGLLDVPSDELERMTAQALRLGTAELSRIADIVHDGLVQMRGTTAPRLVLELICARALLPGVEDSAQAMLSRLERLERRFDIEGATPAPASGRPATTAPDRPTQDRAAPERAVPSASGAGRNGTTPSAGRPPTTGSGFTPAGTSTQPPPVSAPSAPSAVPAQTGSRPGDADAGDSAGGLDAAAVRRVWPEILEHTKRRRVVWSMLQNVMPRAVQGDVLVLDLQHGGLLPRFSDDDVVSVIQDALSEVLGVRWKIRCEVVASRGGPAHAAAPGAEARTSESRTPGRSPAVPQPPPPPEPPPMYEGFDPGDQPMDEEPAGAAEQDRRRLRVVPSPEEQAMATLRDGGLHPETIHDDGPRAG
jgi:DNA polymerase-3 subunit gamma/tau